MVFSGSQHSSPQPHHPGWLLGWWDKPLQHWAAPQPSTTFTHLFAHNYCTGSLMSVCANCCSSSFPGRRAEQWSMDCWFVSLPRAVSADVVEFSETGQRYYSLGWGCWLPPGTTGAGWRIAVLLGQLLPAGLLRD